MKTQKATAIQKHTKQQQCKTQDRAVMEKG
jgi:hypothetical protein